MANPGLSRKGGFDSERFSGGTSEAPNFSAAQNEPFGEAPDGTRVEGAADRRPATQPVDLRDEEGDRGGHTIEKHVGKSEDYLIRRSEREVYEAPFGNTFFLQHNGSFSSLDSANKLVNSTIYSNYDVVALVAAGKIPAAKVESEFGSITGMEAFRETSRSEIYIRTTNAVRVILIHDPTLTRGFRIVTAFPIRK